MRGQCGQKVWGDAPTFNLKMMKKLSLITALITIFLVPTIFASQIAYDDFECGSFNCGAGWAGAWSYTGTCSIVNQNAIGAYDMRGLQSCDARKTVDTTGYTEVNVSFYATARSLENNEYCRYYYFDGTTNHELLTLGNGDDDNVQHYYEFNITPYGLSSDAGIRMYGALSSGDYCYIDNIEVKGSINTNFNIYTNEVYLAGETDVNIDMSSSVTNAPHTFQMYNSNGTKFCEANITSPGFAYTVFSTHCDMPATPDTGAYAVLYLTGDHSVNETSYFNITVLSKDPTKIDISKVYFSPQVLQGSYTEVFATFDLASNISINQATITLTFNDSTQRTLNMYPTQNNNEWRVFITDTYQAGNVQFSINVKSDLYYDTYNNQYAVVPYNLDFVEAVNQVLRILTQPPNVDISGTYYEVGDTAKVIAELSDQGLPVNNASCYATIHYPDGNIFQNHAYMTRISNQGLYTYDVLIPNVIGIYPISVNCDYLTSELRKYVLAAVYTYGESSSGGGTEIWYDDDNYSVLTTETVGNQELIDVTLYFSNVTVENPLYEVLADWNGYTDIGGEMADVSWFNWDNSSWVLSPDKIDSSANYKTLRSPIGQNISPYIILGQYIALRINGSAPLRTENFQIFSDGFEDGTLAPFYEDEIVAPITTTIVNPGFNGTYRARLTSGNFVVGDIEQGAIVLNLSTINYTNVSLTYTRRVIGSESSDYWAVQVRPNSTASWVSLESWTGNQALATVSFNLSSDFDNQSNIQIRWFGYTNYGNDFFDIDDVKVSGMKKSHWHIYTDYINTLVIEPTGVNEIRGGGEFNVKDRLNGIEDSLDDIYQKLLDEFALHYDLKYVMPKVYGTSDSPLLTVYTHKSGHLSESFSDFNCTSTIFGPANSSGIGPEVISEFPLQSHGEGLYYAIPPAPPGGWPTGIYTIETNCIDNGSTAYNIGGFRMQQDYTASLDWLTDMLNNITSNGTVYFQDLLDAINNQAQGNLSSIINILNATKTHMEITSPGLFSINDNVIISNILTYSDSGSEYYDDAASCVVNISGPATSSTIGPIVLNSASMNSMGHGSYYYIFNPSSGGVYTAILSCQNGAKKYFGMSNIRIEQDIYAYLVGVIEAKIDNITSQLNGISNNLSSNQQELLSELTSLQDNVSQNYQELLTLGGNITGVENKLLIINNSIKILHNYVQQNLTEGIFTEFEKNKYDVSIGGTEYYPESPGKVFLNILQDNHYIINASVWLWISYPNGTYFIEKAHVPLTNADQGLYEYNFEVPDTLGVYPITVRMDPDVNFSYVTALNESVIYGNTLSGDYTDTFEDDAVRYKVREQDINGSYRLEQIYEFNGSTIFDSLDAAEHEFVKGIYGWNGKWNDATEDIAIQIWNWTSNAWVNAGNSITKSGSDIDVTGQIGEVLSSGFVENNSWILRFRLIDTQQTGDTTRGRLNTDQFRVGLWKINATPIFFPGTEVHVIQSPLNYTDDFNEIKNYLDSLNYTIDGIGSYMKNNLTNEINDIGTDVQSVLNNQSITSNKLDIISQNISNNYAEIQLLSQLLEGVNTSLTAEINENEQHLLLINTTVNWIQNEITTSIGPYLSSIDGNISLMQIDLSTIINNTDTLETGQQGIVANLSYIQSLLTSLNYTGDLANILANITAINTEVGYIEAKLDCNHTVNIICDRLDALQASADAINLTNEYIWDYLQTNVTSDLTYITTVVEDTNLNVNNMMIYLNTTIYPAVDDLEANTLSILTNQNISYQTILGISSNISNISNQLDLLKSLILSVNSTVLQTGANLTAEINTNEAKLDIITSIVNQTNYYVQNNLTSKIDALTTIVTSINLTVGSIGDYVMNNMTPQLDSMDLKLDGILQNATNIWDQLILMNQNITANGAQLSILGQLIINVNTTQNANAANIISEVNENEVILGDINTTVNTILTNIQAVVEPKLNFILGNITQVNSDLDLINNSIQNLDYDNQLILGNLSDILTIGQTLELNMTDIAFDIKNLQSDITSINLSMETRFDLFGSYLGNISTEVTNIEAKLDCNNSVNVVCDTLYDILNNAEIIKNDTEFIKNYLVGNITIFLENINATVTVIYDLNVNMNTTLNEIMMILQGANASNLYPLDVALTAPATTSYDRWNLSFEINASANSTSGEVIDRFRLAIFDSTPTLIYESVSSFINSTSGSYSHIYHPYYLEPGVYTISITANDTDGNSGVATEPLIITNQVPQDPILQSPLGSENFATGIVNIEWNATSDADQEDLTLEAQYSANSGSSWNPLISQGTQLIVNHSCIAGGLSDALGNFTTSLETHLNQLEVTLNSTGLFYMEIENSTNDLIQNTTAYCIANQSCYFIMDGAMIQPDTYTWQVYSIFGSPADSYYCIWSASGWLPNANQSNVRIHSTAAFNQYSWDVSSFSTGNSYQVRIRADDGINTSNWVSSSDFSIVNPTASGSGSVAPISSSGISGQYKYCNLDTGECWSREEIEGIPNEGAGPLSLVNFDTGSFTGTITGFFANAVDTTQNYGSAAWNWLKGLAGITLVGLVLSILLFLFIFKRKRKSPRRPRQKVNVVSYQVGLEDE